VKQDERITKAGGELVAPRREATILSAHEARVISAAAAVDPRTVMRYLAGAKIASTCAARIADALYAHGFDHLVRQSSMGAAGG
jgi:hypothetical protein